MCGVAGVIRVFPALEREKALAMSPEQSIPERWLDVLDGSVAYRGPDGAGRFRDRTVRGDGSVVDVALVHRRLSILDHAGGAQPMVSRGKGSGGTIGGAGEGDETIAVVFNGCVYNHRSLRAELTALGHRFSSDHSDTEVLVHGWREWGDGRNGRSGASGGGLWDRIVGMGAMGVWDGGCGELALFRTSPGEKPLYAWENKAGMAGAFSSMPGGLFELAREIAGREPRDGRAGVEREALARWLAFGWDAESALMSGVRQIQFGVGVSLCGGAGSRLDEGTKTSQMRGGDRERALSIKRVAHDAEALCMEVEKLIEESVAARIEADVPVGCLLSGGVDSSVVAAMAMKSAQRLKTICVRMPERAYDESEFAAQVAAHIGSEHRTIDVSPSPAQDLERLIHTLGLPFADSSLLPTYWACRAAREEVGVALTGDGGDELFFGYERYRGAEWARRMGRLAWLFPSSFLKRSDPKSRGDRIARLIEAARDRSSASLNAIFQRRDLERLIGKDAARWAGYGDDFSGGEGLRRSELYGSLQGDMLRKTDVASMLAPVELRAPLLDQTLVSALQALGPRELMPTGERKEILRRVARRVLPREIVDRPKMGFAIPIGEWFRTDFGGMRTMLLDHLRSVEPFGPAWLGVDIDRGYVERMLDEHLGGKSGVVKRDHSQRLYGLLAMSIWAKRVSRSG